MFDFCIGNHEDFGSLTQNCLQLDKDKSTVSIFSVFLAEKYAAITTQKRSYVGSFNFNQQRFVFAHLFPYIEKNRQNFISISREKISPAILLFSQNDCQSITKYPFQTM